MATAVPTISAIESIAPTSWKVDFLNRGAVDFCLGHGDFVKDFLGQIFGSRIDLVGPVNHFGNVVQMPVGVFGRMLDIDVNGTKTALFDFLKP